jgi:GAF domain-containing protein
MESKPSSSGPSPQLGAAAGPAIATARDRLGVRRTALFWLDERSGRLSCIATAGSGGTDGWLGQTLAAGVGMAGRAVKEGRPVRTPDLLADPRVPVAAWLRERLEQEGLRAVAAVPVRVDGVIRGALGFLDGPGRAFDDEALKRIEALAEEVARAMTSATRSSGSALPGCNRD